MPFVVDASVTMAWCFDDEKNNYTEAILDRLSTDTAVVPAIWPLEVINVLIQAERKGRLTTSEADQFLLTLGELPIVVMDLRWPSDAEPLILRARQSRLTAYDTAYLVLALRQGCAIATQDRELKEAASDLGIALLAEESKPP